MGGSGRGEEPPRPPGLGGSPPTWVEAAAGGVDRVTRANTHPALRPSPAAPASRAASAPPRPVTRGRPDRHSLFPGAGRRPAGPTCPARRGGAVGLGGHGAAPAPQPPPGPARPAPRPLPAPSALRPPPAPRPPGPAAPPPEPGGKEGRRCPLRASPGCSPLRRFQNTQPGSRAGGRAEAGGRAGRGHPSSSRPRREGRPRARREGLGPRGRAAPPGPSASKSLKEKAERAPVETERGDRGRSAEEEGRGKGGRWGACSPNVAPSSQGHSPSS